MATMMATIIATIDGANEAAPLPPGGGATEPVDSITTGTAEELLEDETADGGGITPPVDDEAGKTTTPVDEDEARTATPPDDEAKLTQTALVVIRKLYSHVGASLINCKSGVVAAGLQTNVTFVARGVVPPQKSPS